MTFGLSINHRPWSESTYLDRGLRFLLARKLTKLVEGRLRIVDGLWCRTFGQADAAVIHAQLNIYDTRTYRAVIFGGTIGAADSYAN